LVHIATVGILTGTGKENERTLHISENTDIGSSGFHGLFQVLDLAAFGCCFLEFPGVHSASNCIGVIVKGVSGLLSAQTLTADEWLAPNSVM